MELNKEKKMAGGASQSETRGASSDSATIKALVERNLVMSQEILDLSLYIKSYVRWQKIFGWLKFLVIAVPIILGFLYLPAMLKTILSSYGLEAGTASYSNLIK